MKKEKPITTVLGYVDQKMMNILSKDKGVSFSNYRNEFHKASNFNQLYEYPVHVDIELTNLCNYSCGFCVQGLKPKDEYYRKKKILEKEVVFDLMEHCRKIGVKSVQFNGQDEPTLYPDLIKVLKYASNLGFDDIFFNTNGSKLNKEYAADLIESGLTKLQISIDAFSKETYFKVRKKRNYEQIVKNILSLVESREKKKKQLPLIRVSFVVNEFNCHEVESFKEFWQDKVDFIGIQNLVNIHNTNVENRKELKGVRCNMPYFRMMVKADGSVKPCCTGFGDRLGGLGNIHEIKIQDIWNSKRLKNFQEIHRNYRWMDNKVCDLCVNSFES